MNQSFNVVNGDLFRWRHLWERLARHFGMENGGVQTVSLARMMADKEPLWRAMAQRHGLRPLALAEIVNWDYADMTFRQDWDHISSTLKARRFGFQEEGRHRAYALRDGAYVDVLSMARLHPHPPAALGLPAGEPE